MATTARNRGHIRTTTSSDRDGQQQRDERPQPGDGPVRARDPEADGGKERQGQRREQRERDHRPGRQRLVRAAAAELAVGEHGRERPSAGQRRVHRVAGERDRGHRPERRAHAAGEQQPPLQLDEREIGHDLGEGGGGDPVPLGAVKERSGARQLGAVGDDQLDGDVGDGGDEQEPDGDPYAMTGDDRPPDRSVGGSRRHRSGPHVPMVAAAHASLAQGRRPA